MTDAALDRRARILRTALGVFTRLGYAKVTMGDLAAAAGISRQGLYRQFAGKHEVLNAAVAHELERAMEAAEQALAGNADLADRLTTALDAWLGRGTGESADDVAILGRENAAELATTFTEARERFVDALASALQRDRGVSGGIAHTAAGALHAAATGWKHVSVDRAGFRAGVRDAAELIVDGAVARASLPSH